MHADIKALRDINMQIAAAEDEGDRGWLSGILAPRLAFQRADKDQTVENEVTYLGAVAPRKDKEPPRVTEPIRDEDIDVYGGVAVVRCVVSRGGPRFRNVRLFVRRGGEWKLLGWANEPL